MPSADNAIYHLAGALTRIENFPFPAEIDDIRGITFGAWPISRPERSHPICAPWQNSPPDKGAVSRLSVVPYYNALLRTTCVATILSRGHAPNALPQTARANVNCRIFPGGDPENIRTTLERDVADPKVTVSPVPVRAADGKLARLVTVPPSPLLPELTQAMDKTVHGMWGNIPRDPTMSTGATDGRITRTAHLPSYGIACIFFDIDDNRAHGKDERVGVQEFYEGVEFNYQLMRELSGGNT